AATTAAAPAAPGGGAPAAGNDSAHGDYPTGRLDRSHAGTAAPALAFQGPDGQPARLASFRGRPVLVNRWATWCGPCIVEMPSLEALAARETGNLAILTVSEDLNGRQQVTDFFAEHAFQHIVSYSVGEYRILAVLRVDYRAETVR